MITIGKFSTLAVLVALAINSASSPAFAKEPASKVKSAAKVNGVSIPQARVDLRVKAATAQGQVDSPELRKAVREDMINLELMSQKATKMGLSKNPEIVQQIELAKQSVLVSAFVQDYLKSHPVSDAQFQQEYDHLTSKLGSKEYNVRHILVDSEDEAKNVIAQLGKNGEFDKLAKEKSKDSGSAERGGSLDWAVPSNFVPEFANALVKLNVEEYTREPVQTQFGWHVIKLDEVRNLKVPPLEEVKPQMQQRLQQQTIQQAISEMRTNAKIE